MTTRHEELLAHADFVRDLARCLVGDVYRSADVSQQACLAALERPPLGRPMGAWLNRVTHNIAGRLFRSERRRARREEAVARPDRVPLQATGEAADPVIRGRCGTPRAAPCPAPRWACTGTRKRRKTRRRSPFPEWTAPSMRIDCPRPARKDITRSTCRRGGGYYVCLKSTWDPNRAPLGSPFPSDFDGEPWQGKWIETPAGEVDFTARINPTGKVIVTVLDPPAGGRLAAFKEWFWSKETKNYFHAETSSEVLEKTLPIQ